MFLLNKSAGASLQLLLTLYSLCHQGTALKHRNTLKKKETMREDQEGGLMFPEHPGEHWLHFLAVCITHHVITIKVSFVLPRDPVETPKICSVVSFLVAVVRGC